MAAKDDVPSNDFIKEDRYIGFTSSNFRHYTEGIKMRRYYLKYGNSYFARDNNNNLYLTTNKKDAFYYLEKDKKKLENIKKNLPKNFVKNQVVVSYEENDDLYESSDGPIINKIKSNKNNGKFDDTINKIAALSENFQELVNSKDELIKQLSEVDMKICDELHYIEFYKFSASEGYKRCKEIQDLRDERRIIKNKLEAINIISTQTCEGLANGKTLKAFQNIEDKVYEPRILKDLFKDKEKRRRKIS